MRVVLQRQDSKEFSQPAGRDLLIHGSHSFALVAAAIDRAFAGWDLSHLHEFRIPDGRRVGTVDEEFGEGDDELDERMETVATAGLKVGDRFEYVFDFGDGWEHVCTVLRDRVDAKKESGIIPAEITPVFGWGSIHDQYGRATPDSEEAEE